MFTEEKSKLKSTEDQVRKEEEHTHTHTMPPVEGKTKCASLFKKYAPDSLERQPQSVEIHAVLDQDGEDSVGSCVKRSNQTTHGI